MELLEVAVGTEAERSTRGALALRSSPASKSVMELTSLVLWEIPSSLSVDALGGPLVLEATLSTM